TTGRAPAAEAAPAVARWRPPVLDSRLSVGAPMAPVPPRGPTRHRARLASPGVDGLLALAVPTANGWWAAPHREGAASSHPEDDRGEPPLGTAPPPGRARTARVHRVGPGRAPRTAPGF